MSFETIVRDALRRSLGTAHQVLDQYSLTGETGAVPVEVAAMNVVFQCARDTYDYDPERLSETKRPADPLSDPTLTIAGIPMNRDDVGERKPLKFVERDGFRFLDVNNNSDPPAYSATDWEEERLAEIQTCLNKGANVICLGEFDFPPCEPDVDHAAFRSNVQSMIDRADFPVFLLAGSRHEYAASSPYSAASCHNIARVFVNKALKTKTSVTNTDFEFPHYKLVPATKAGEVLSPRNSIKTRYYETSLGRIAVLICVDAYDPTILFSMLYPRLFAPKGVGANQPNRVDLILVPAYNLSPKLYYACQVLSLLCKCTVVLVDACSKFSRAPQGARSGKEKCVELFFRGRAFRDIRSETKDIGKVRRGTGRATVWELKQNYLNAAAALDRQSSPTKFFDDLGNFVTETAV